MKSMRNAQCVGNRESILKFLEEITVQRFTVSNQIPAREAQPRPPEGSPSPEGRLAGTAPPTVGAQRAREEPRPSTAHLPQLDERPRVVPACDLVQEVIHHLLAVAPSILHKLLQARRGRERAG